MLSLVPSAPTSDDTLCQALLTGDRAAFGELVRRHQDAVFRLVRRYVATPDDAADVMQRAFLQAFEGAAAASRREVPFRAWLFRIAINVAKNHSRDARRWPRAPIDALDTRASADSPLASLEAAELRALTRQAVETLPPRQREVFALRVDAGLPFAEVAVALDISEANAKSHFHHAVKRLRDEVQRATAPRGAQ
ncbi:MAG: sigma-70 family RNA polymerase sigma factor [Archangium sp.]|nr:sigma-70 family RNA polymerase sigma factor [Archangium sp.]